MMSSALINFCMDCTLWHADNPHPFERIKELKSGHCSEFHMGSHTIRYRHGLYHILDEIAPSSAFAISLEDIIIYSKYYAKCHLEKQDKNFFISSEFISWGN
jgi:hypothetical protein